MLIKIERSIYINTFVIKSQNVLFHLLSNKLSINLTMLSNLLVNLVFYFSFINFKLLNNEQRKARCQQFFFNSNNNKTNTIVIFSAKKNNNKNYRCRFYSLCYLIVSTTSFI